MKKELANLKGNGPVIDLVPKQRAMVDPLIYQRSYNSKEGLGYVAPKKSKNKKKAKKTNPAQAKKTPIESGVVIRDNTPRSDFAGTNNPHHTLYVDYYGDVYAKYVGPYDGDVSWSIWVPRTLVTNKRGLCFRWVKMGA